jgi:hypothetical protein
MTILLKDQPVASTALDRHGESFTEEALREGFARLPAERPLYDNHDITSPPVGRVFNCRLDRVSNGALAIVCDVEIFDDERANEWKGLSVGFHQMPVAHSTSRAEFGISFNPRYIDRADIEDVRQEFGATRVELLERGEKSLLATGLAIYIVCQGFFNEAGADAYRLWKATLAKALTRSDSAKVAIQSPRDDRWPEVLLIPAPELDPAQLVPIDVHGLMDEARQLAPGNDIAKVVIAVTDKGIAYLDHAVDVRGVAIRPPSGEQ